MVFVDRAEITVAGGTGGRGCAAFAQPPYTRYPYPDGGDGGRGGDVVFRASPHVATLLDFQYRRQFAAGRGGHGGSNRKSGKRGADLMIPVPVGTVVHDAERRTVIKDLNRSGEDLVVARGGAGGFGNASKLRLAPRLRSGRRATPEATPGTPGEERCLLLELKLIADVGLIGFPNAGKSSLLARISTARPKVAPYPFTTRYPVLGVVRVPGRGSFVACDIPGLTEGAHQGKGLVIEFLRHIERTRVLVHLVDLEAVDGRDPADAYRQLNRELAAYSRALARKPQLIAANKLDVPEAREGLEAFARAVGSPVYPISAATGEGVPALLQTAWDALQRER